MKTIFLVVNKNWEVEPVLNTLTQKEFRPAALPYPSELRSPRPDSYRGMEPRAVYELPNRGSGNGTGRGVVRAGAGGPIPRPARPPGRRDRARSVESEMGLRQPEWRPGARIFAVALLRS